MLISYVGEALLNATRNVVEFLGVPQGVIEAVEILTGVDLNKIHVPQYAQSTYSSVASPKVNLAKVVSGSASANAKPQESNPLQYTPLFCRETPKEFLPPIPPPVSKNKPVIDLPAFCSPKTLEIITNFPPSPSYLTSQIQGYDVEREIGRGGTSRVYLAKNELGERVAIKVYHPDMKYADLNVHEFEVHQKPGFIHSRDFGVFDNGLRYVVMDYADHGNALTVAHRFRALVKAGFTQKDDANDYLKEMVLDFVQDVARAHEQGIIVCDVKPENYFPEYGLGDGGTAITADHPQTNIVGSPYYMAPELRYALVGTSIYHYRATPQGFVPENIDEIPAYFISADRKIDDSQFIDASYSPDNRFRKADYLSDQYSLGKSILEILLGEENVPTMNMSSENAYARAIEYEVKSQDYPIEVADVLLKATDEVPSNRYTSVNEMLCALRAAFDGILHQPLAQDESRNEVSDVQLISPELRHAINAAAQTNDGGGFLKVV